MISPYHDAHLSCVAYRESPDIAYSTFRLIGLLFLRRPYRRGGAELQGLDPLETREHELKDKDSGSVLLESRDPSYLRRLALCPLAQTRRTTYLGRTLVPCRPAVTPLLPPRAKP